MTHPYVRCDSFMCDMTHSYVRRDSFVCATWFPCATGPIICATGHSYVPSVRDAKHHPQSVTSLWNMTSTHPPLAPRDSSIRARWLIRVRGSSVRDVYAQHDIKSIICATRLVHMCDATHHLLRHNSEISTDFFSWHCYSLINTTYLFHRQGDQKAAQGSQRNVRSAWSRMLIWVGVGS